MIDEKAQRATDERLTNNVDGDPLCDFCFANNGVIEKATHVAQQYAKASKDSEKKHWDNPSDVSHWAFCCKGHVEGWNEGGDYTAKVFELKNVTEEMS